VLTTAFVHILRVVALPSALLLLALRSSKRNCGGSASAIVITTPTAAAFLSTAISATLASVTAAP